MGRRLCVGVVVGAHGVRGAVRIRSFTERAADIASLGELQDEEGKRRFRLTLLGGARDGVTARLEGLDDRDAAQALAGTRLMVDRAMLPEPEGEEEFYASDLVGLRAERVDGVLLGTVTRVLDFGAGDIIEVGGAGRTLLVPFTRAAVPVVDVEGGRLVIDPPREVEPEEELEVDGGRGGR